MCRNIRTLFHLAPPVAEDEIRNAALQYVRKVSGFVRPSRANEEAFTTAVDEIAAATSRLLAALQSATPPRDRAEMAAKAKARSAERYGR